VLLHLYVNSVIEMLHDIALYKLTIDTDTDIDIDIDSMPSDISDGSV